MSETNAPKQPTCHRPGSIWDDHDVEYEEHIAEIASTGTGPKADDDIAVEIKHYLNRPNIPREANPLAEWENLKSLFPNIYPIAMKYLTMSPTSVPSERLFAQSGQIVTKQRNRLSGKHVNQLLFLSSVSEDLWMS